MADVTREKALAAIAKGKRPQPLDVPEWGGTVYVRKMTSGDLRAAGAFDKDRDEDERMAKLIIAAVSTKAGDPLFLADDLPALIGDHFATVMRVFGEVAKANGISNDKLDEAIADFEEVQGDGSSIA